MTETSTWAEMSPRERDALVATEVIGEPAPPVPTDNDGLVAAGILADWHRTSNMSPGGSWTLTTSGYDSGDHLLWEPRPYSTDIAAAWQVVEKMADRWYVTVEGIRGHWEAELVHHDVARPIRDSAVTAPEAISLAALRAVGVEV